MSYDPLNVPKAARMLLVDVLPPKNLDGRRREIWMGNVHNRLRNQFRTIEAQRAAAREARELARLKERAKEIRTTLAELDEIKTSKPRAKAKPRKKAAAK